MKVLLRVIRGNPLLWLLVFVPLAIVAEHADPTAHTRLFGLSILAIVPLAGLLSLATESVAVKTGDAVGGLLNATLGNLTELVICLAALQAGEQVLVKASIAGAIVTNTLFMLGMSFVIGGLRHRLMEFNSVNARLLASQLFLAAIALTIPSVLGGGEGARAAITQQLSLCLAFVLIAIYGLGLLFSLGTHREVFAAAGHGHGEEEEVWPIGVAVTTLAAVTVAVALVSEIFVASVQHAAEDLGMSKAFVGFVVVALVGGAAEFVSAFAGAWKNRLDLSVGIALGSSAQIALFVAPVLVLASYFIGMQPIDLQFWPGAVAMIFLSTLTAVLIAGNGRAAWFSGVLILGVYLLFAITLYLLPPATA